MLLRTAKRLLFPYHRNLGGWRSRRKLIVIESDDWGAIRMPSKAVYQRCLKAGFPVDRTWYERYDSLLSEDDLELLFEVLASHKDSNGRSPVITANVIVGNPDFDRIEASNRTEYFHELISETFKRYPKHGRCLNLWREAQRQGLFYPQFHGREHLNIALFMEALRNEDPVAEFAFENRMPGCIPNGARARQNLFVRATEFRSSAEKDAVRQAQLEGLRIFEGLFGFRSRTMIPTNYVWSSDFDADVASMGIEGFQGSVVMREQHVDGSYTPIRRIMGEQNSLGQTYLVRNAAFEPSQSLEPRMRAVDHCLYQIRGAFQLGKPAVIASHRINFCGYLDERNRDENLLALGALLESIVRNWPDVEFVTSTELVDIVNQA